MPAANGSTTPSIARVSPIATMRAARNSGKTFPAPAGARTSGGARAWVIVAAWAIGEVWVTAVGSVIVAESEARAGSEAQVESEARAGSEGRVESVTVA